MASFWDEDDDDDDNDDLFLESPDPFSPTTTTRPLSSQTFSPSNTQNKRKTAPSFVCPTCGNTEHYYIDSATNQQICELCFSVSQQTLTETTWEDVQGLGVRTHTGGLQQQQIAGPKKQRTRGPLSAINRSTKLPSVKVCLKGMQSILTACVERLLLQDESVWSLPKTIVPDRPQLQTELLQNVKKIWLRYLRGWRDGADFYGNLYPSVRFCFRDFFLSKLVVSRLVNRQLVHQVLHHNDDNSNDSIDDDDSLSDEHETDSDTDHSKDTGSLVEGTKSREKKDGRSSAQPVPPPSSFASIRQMIYTHNAKKQLGYREVALLIPPSLKLIPAILYLALLDSQNRSVATTTTHEICQWIAAGILPLTNAYENLLNENLQRQLHHCRTFFTLPYLVRPNEVDHWASFLCVACRKRKIPLRNGHRLDTCQVPKVGQTRGHRHGTIRLWDVDDIPVLLARLVHECGLDQHVLNRALVLCGFPFSNPSVKADPVRNRQRRLRATGLSRTDPHPTTVDDLPVIAVPGNMTRREELLAVIAISCQLDPDWRRWEFKVQSNDDGNNKKPFVHPVNESQLQFLQDSGLTESYLEFLERNNVPEDPLDSDDDMDSNRHFSKKATLLPDDFVLEAPSESELSKEQSRSIRSSAVVAGRALTQQQDVTNLKCRKELSKNSITTKSMGGPLKQSRADRTIYIPRYDFSQNVDRLNNWIPKQHCPDLDVQRLVEYLAYVTDGDVLTIQTAMQRMLNQKTRL